MLAGFHNCCQPPRTDAGMHIYTHQKTQLVGLPLPERKHTDNLQLEPVFKNSIEEVGRPPPSRARLFSLPPSRSPSL